MNTQILLTTFYYCMYSKKKQMLFDRTENVIENFDKSCCERELCKLGKSSKLLRSLIGTFVLFIKAATMAIKNRQTYMFFACLYLY